MIYKMWHDKVQVFSLDQEVSHYFKITIYKIKKIIYNKYIKNKKEVK